MKTLIRYLLLLAANEVMRLISGKKEDDLSEKCKGCSVHTYKNFEQCKTCE